MNHNHPIHLLGVRVTDAITGFAGTITGVVTYISGCAQALVVPPAENGNKLRDGQWFDVQRLLPDLDARPVVLNNEQTPGCDAPAPKR